MSRGATGFALPAVLITSVVLLMLLVTGMSATVAVNNGLRDQYYTKLAELATDAGDAFAAACFAQGGNQVTWADDKPLRPNTDCAGNINSSASAYVLDQSGVRTYFVVDTSMLAKGYTEGVRPSSNLAWRVWTSGSASAVAVPGGASMPVGTIVEGVWTSAPDGYLLSNGACVSRTTYSALYAVIGTMYDSSSTCSSSQFKLPDARGRVLVQLSSDSEFNALGETGGEKAHVLTIPEMPSHSHAIADPGHSHRQYVTANSGGSAIRRDFSSDGNGGTYDQGINGGGSTTGITINSTGGGTAHNNLQPYITVNRAIKY